MPTLQFKGKVFVQNHHLAVPFHELQPVKLPRPLSGHVPTITVPDLQSGGRLNQEGFNNKEFNHEGHEGHEN